MTEHSGSLALIVWFDGRQLSENFVTGIAEDPVVAWGAVFNETGSTVPGEVWLIVAKNAKFIYYHLTEEPNADSGSTSYGGYTVKIKAAMTSQFYSYGSGSAVPVIGNDTDAFFVTTTKIWVNSAFTEQGSPLLTGLTITSEGVTTGTVSPADFLIHLFDAVQVYRLEAALSSGRMTGLQVLAPDGTVLDETSAGSIASGSSSSDCQAFGEGAANAVTSFQSGIFSAQNYLAVLGGGALGGIIGGAATTPLGGAGAGVGATVLADVQVAINNGVANIAMGVTGLLYSALAEGACNFVTLVTDELLRAIEDALAELEFPGAEDMVQVVVVCDQFGTELVGSSATDDGSGGIIVTGHTEQVCTEWHYEVV